MAQAPSSILPASVLPYKTANVRDHYRIGKKLGQGHSGTTYRCVRKADGAEYACKSIPKRKLLCREDYEDVYREIQIMHHLSEHPNVTHIQGTYEDAFYLSHRATTASATPRSSSGRSSEPFMAATRSVSCMGTSNRRTSCSTATMRTPRSRPAALSFLCSTCLVINYLGSLGAPIMLHRRCFRNAMVQKLISGVLGVILYILLSGVPPFWTETEEGTSSEILHGKLDFESDPWPSISDSAKDVVRGMLTRDPKKRLSAHEVLCHPWIIDDGVAPNKPTDSAVLSRLKHFSAMNMFTKMALNVIAESMSEHEIGGLRELFKKFDTDNSGTITSDELKDGLKRLGSALSENEIQTLMDAADIDRNGIMDCTEFIAATLHMNKLEREENLLRAFSFFDKDGNGFITTDELSDACYELRVDDIHLEDMIKDIDQDNDGRIGYDEFVAMMRKGNTAREP